jgi:Fe-S-cluster containining protein
MNIQHRLKKALEPHGEEGFLQAVRIIKVEMRILKYRIATDGPIAAVKELYQKIDTEYVRVMEDAKISCKKGCSFCCHLNVDLTKLEAELIEAHCEERNLEIDREKFRRQLKLTVSNRHLSKDSACTFLKDNECSIYEARPIACRTYYVLNDANRCDSKKYPKGKTTQATAIMADCMAAALDNISESKSMQQYLSVPRETLQP